MKKILKLMLLCLVGAIALSVVWTSLSDSKKRYLMHVGRQVPAMPFRYFT